MSDSFVYFLLFVAFILWVISKSPALRWFSAFMLLAIWGAISVAGPVAVAIVVHIPKGSFVAAALTIAVGLGALGSFWFAWGLPWMKELFKEFKGSMHLWEK